uniref:Uncharacterized protein n=1 Tax=Romanomermis culicivorax TaxID=13658 RepID=A0A915ICX9_ROMCU
MLSKIINLFNNSEYPN